MSFVVHTTANRGKRYRIDFADQSRKSVVAVDVEFVRDNVGSYRRLFDNRWPVAKQDKALLSPTVLCAIRAAQRSNEIAGYIHFGREVVHKHGLGQTQYVSRYIGGRHGHPDLSEGLRFAGDVRDYHDITIHQDDVAEFVRRAPAAQAEKGLACD